MLAMTLHIGWQFHAYQELNVHLGGSQLSKIEDQDELSLMDWICLSLALSIIKYSVLIVSVPAA